jgi:hypothetical protein
VSSGAEARYYCPIRPRGEQAGFTFITVVSLIARPPFAPGNPSLCRNWCAGRGAV